MALAKVVRRMEEDLRAIKREVDAKQRMIGEKKQLLQKRKDRISSLRQETEVCKKIHQQHQSTVAILEENIDARKIDIIKGNERIAEKQRQNRLLYNEVMQKKTQLDGENKNMEALLHTRLTAYQNLPKAQELALLETERARLRHLLRVLTMKGSKSTSQSEPVLLKYATGSHRNGNSADPEQLVLDGFTDPAPGISLGPAQTAMAKKILMHKNAVEIREPKNSEQDVDMLENEGPFEAEPEGAVENLAMLGKDRVDNGATLSQNTSNLQVTPEEPPVFRKPAERIHSPEPKVVERYSVTKEFVPPRSPATHQKIRADSVHKASSSYGASNSPVNGGMSQTSLRPNSSKGHGEMPPPGRSSRVEMPPPKLSESRQQRQLSSESQDWGAFGAAFEPKEDNQRDSGFPFDFGSGSPSGSEHSGDNVFGALFGGSSAGKKDKSNNGSLFGGFNLF